MIETGSTQDRCYYCNRKLDDTNRTIDHKIPLARGGANTPANKVLACQSCNIQKGDLTPDEFELYKIAKKNYKKKLTHRSYIELLDKLGLYRTQKKRSKRNALEYKVRNNLLEEDI